LFLAALPRRETTKKPFDRLSVRTYVFSISALLYTQRQPANLMAKEEKEKSVVSRINHQII